MNAAMCAQLEVLKKIRKAGKMNGFAIDLAEAQARDFMTMKKRMETMEDDIASIKETQIEQGKVQVEHTTKLDLIIARLNSPVEQERLDGQKWNLITSIAKHKAAWVILALVLFAFALAGDRMASMVGEIIRRLL